MHKATVSLIVAMNNNRVIGSQGQIPWYIPEDFKMFKDTTMGKPIIMGRKTHESIGRVLPGRPNIVLSREYTNKGSAWDDLKTPVYASGLSAAIIGASIWAGKNRQDEIFVIGGGQVYKEAIHRADRLYLTRVDNDSQGDTHFPRVDIHQWRLTSIQPFERVGQQPAYAFEVWARK